MYQSESDIYRFLHTKRFFFDPFFYFFFESMKLPNILITGTPGTGKTQTAQQAAERTGLKHVNVGELIKANSCYEETDETFDTMMIDDDKVCDLLEPVIEEGGCIVDFHSCELFPERWFDLVLVLRANTQVLFDRLTERNYNEKKKNENIECEIMQVVLEEARESYDPNMVHELQSNDLNDLDSNIERIAQWLDNWKSNNNYQS
jgi:adenylate kinase